MEHISYFYFSKPQAMNSFKNKNKKRDVLTLNAPQKPFGKNLVYVSVVFPEPLLTNRGQRNTNNENPSPFLGGAFIAFHSL